jgi:hypothetical protein
MEPGGDGGDELLSGLYDPAVDLLPCVLCLQHRKIDQTWSKGTNSKIYSLFFYKTLKET